MAKRKERSLEELYKLTVKLAKARLTPILEGNCQIQGPVDESDSEFEVDLVDNLGAKSLEDSLAEPRDSFIGTNVGLVCGNHIENSAVEIDDGTCHIVSNGKEAGEDLSDKCKTRKIVKDFIAREEALHGVKKKAHENVRKAARACKTKKIDLASTSSTYGQEVQKGESIHIFEVSEKAVKCTDSKLNCKAELLLSGEPTEENCEKYCPPHGTDNISQDCPLSCESVRSFVTHKDFNILGSEDIPNNSDLDVRVCSDDVDLEEPVDLGRRIASIEGNDSNEIEELRNSMSFDAVKTQITEKNLDMLSKVLTSARDKRNQTEIGSRDLPREGVCISTDRLVDFGLDIHFPSSEHTQKISEVYVNEDLCNAESNENNRIMDNESKIETADNVTDGLIKSIGNLVDTNLACVERTNAVTPLHRDIAVTSHACLEVTNGLPCMVFAEEVIPCGSGKSMDVIDEFQHVSKKGRLVLQDNDMPSRVPQNSSIETVKEYLNPCLKENFSVPCIDSMDLSSQFGPSELSATGSHKQMDAQNRCITEETLSQETIYSLPLVGTLNPLAIQFSTTAKERGGHSSFQQGEDFARASSTDHVEFLSSEKATVTAAWENTAIMTDPRSILQTAEDPKDECVNSNSLSGFPDMGNSHPSSEARKDINQAPVEVTADFQTAVIEKPTQMVINEDLFVEGTCIQLDLDEHSRKDSAGVELSNMKEASLVSETLSGDKLQELALVEDDVKVCDICGDTGHEDMLAICSSCNDGAEHIYCMQTMLDKMPEGNWLCECCKSKNSSFKRVETPQNVSSISKPAFLSTKKQGSNCSSHSRLSAKGDRKMLEPEIKRTVKGISSLQASKKRRAELLEVGSVAKKQSVEVKSGQQGISCSKSNSALSRDASFKALDMGRMKPSLAASLTGNQVNSSIQTIEKSSTAIGVESPRLHVGLQSTKSRFTSVNSLTSESVPFTEGSSNPLSSGLPTSTIGVPLSSKSVDTGISPVPTSRSSNVTKSTANPKIEKDFEEGAQATVVKESTSSGLTNGGFIKATKNCLLFKSKAETSISTTKGSTTSLNFQNVCCVQKEEMRIGEQRKDGTDLLTSKALEKSGNTSSDSIAMGIISLPLFEKPAMNDACHNQAALASRKESCNPKPLMSQEKSTVGLSSTAPVNTNEECTHRTLSEEPVPPLAVSSSLSEGGTVAIKLLQFGSSEELSNSASQVPKGQSLVQMTSRTKAMLVADNSFALDSENCGSPTNKPVGEVFSSSVETYNNDVRSSKNSPSFTWPSQNFLPAAGSTRCYKCKELGHSAQFCSNRSSADGGTNHLRVSALIASAARSSREMSGSSSGKWKSLLETAVPGNLKAYESKRACVSSQFDEQDPGGRSNGDLLGQASTNLKPEFALSPKEPTDICGKFVSKSSVSHGFSISACLLGRDVSIATLDPGSGFFKDSSINGMSAISNLAGESSSAKRFVQKNTKSSADGQTYSSEKILVDGECPFISIRDCSKLATTTSIPQCIVQPAESTVTSVRRNISRGLPVLSDGSYPGTCLRVTPCQQSFNIETVKIATFPEHNFIWQGGFEVSNKENPINYYDGIQAHASTCAVPKVLDAAKKFPSRVKLEEVPRLSAWPVQFQCTRPIDGNIALYFFAKDLESYERPYKKLLGHMLKNDFALRGNFDGVELLIFLSNQLPEKSQRWNRLFFLWGVFRERKANCIESSAYPQERTHGQLSTATLTAGNKEIHREAEGEKSIELQTSGQTMSSQVSFQREKINSSHLGHASGPSPVSSSSLERQDNSSDSSKIAQVSSHSSGRQGDIERERSKSRDYDYDRGRERIKDMEYTIFRYKDTECDKEWKPREREREREWRIASDRGRDQRNLTRRRENSSRESRHSWDSRHDSGCHYSHSCSRSPPHHGSRLHSPSIRTNNHDRHHSRTHSSECDQMRHVRPSSGAELWERSPGDILFPRANSFNGILVDGKGHRKLKKSHSELCVKENYKEHDSSSMGLPDHNISSIAQHNAGLNATAQLSGCSVPGHSQQEDQDCNFFIPEDSQVTERFFFPGSRDAGRDCNTAKISEQWSINLNPKLSSPHPSTTVQTISLVEGDDQEPPDLDAPNLELVLGAKKSSPKPGVLPLFAQLLNKNSSQEPTSPTTSSLIQGSEDGSTLSLSLAFPLSQKEKTLKSVMKKDKTLSDGCNVNTSLLLFGSGIDS